jgi:cell wall-associated NlpC family hydrolase
MSPWKFIESGRRHDTARRLDRVCDTVVGVPFVLRSTTLGGMDCYTLLSYTMAELYNIQLPPLEDLDYDEESVTMYSNLILGHWGTYFESTHEVYIGDVLFMKFTRGKMGIFADHFAIYAGNGRILHTTRPTGAVVDSRDKIHKHIVQAVRIK